MSDSLREMAGMVVMVGFRGQTAAPGTEIARSIRELGLSGVVLFDVDASTRERGRNIAGPAQLAELTSQLRDAAGGRLLIAVDQEGGAVARLNPGNGFPAFPSAEELGRTGHCSKSSGTQNDIDTTISAEGSRTGHCSKSSGTPYNVDATFAVAASMADHLANAGVNVNFAPVVDLNVNPASPIIGGKGRAFSHDADAVAAHARAFLEAHRRRNVACALKHFPGHGSSTGDTHLTTVDVTDTWSAVELQPYRTLISEGGVDMVMVGHLMHRKYDPRLPASLSRPTITGLLREELGFEGVVVVDDLDMAAAACQWSLLERVALALGAGADLLLFGNNLTHDPHLPQRIVEPVVAAVESGMVSMECLRDHAERVRRLKSRLG